MVLLGILYCNFAVGEVEVVDDIGKALRLEFPAGRIISLAPNITELVFAAGGGGRLVGVVAGSDYPPAARTIPAIGSYNRINLEKILALQPDLIIAWHKGNKAATVRNLKNLGLKVLLLKFTELEDIPRAIAKIGKLLGNTINAGKAAAEFTTRLIASKPVKFKKRPRVFIQIWNRPLITLNHEDLYSKIVSFCGAENIFAKKNKVAPIVNLEEVIKIDPEIIILSSKEKSQHPWKVYWQRWQQLQAVRNNQIFFINPDLTNRASPRIIAGVKKVCAVVHGTQASK